MTVPLPARPVFLVGISQRCGTHYLYDLLVRHPDARPALSATSWEGSWEDHLLEASGYLARFADHVAAANRLNDERTRGVIMAGLGAGLAQFLRTLDPAGDQDRRPVTKTPGTRHLELFPELFPDQRVLLLVREPAAAVASAVRTFGPPAERWIRYWRNGARRILRLRESHPDVGVLVRYEDLYADLAGALGTVLTAVGLDPARYDYAGVRNLPVRGSAQLGGPPRRINWFPVERTAEFDPLGRGRWLSPADRERLAWLAGAEMRALGYPADPGPPASRVPVHRVRDVVSDTRIAGRRAVELAGAAWQTLHRLS